MTAGPFILEIDDDGGEPALRVTTPAAVLVVLSADDLASKLVQFSDPVANGVVRNSRHGRRWYVEKILPALRFYCAKFGAAVPDWLADTDRWVDLPDEDKDLLFGPGDLRLREFQQVRCPDIAVVRPGAGGQAG